MTIYHGVYDNISRRKYRTYWITKATNTHSECVILIAFPRQQWLPEYTLMLHCSTLPLLFMYYLLLPRYRNVKTTIHNITILFVLLPLQSLGLHHRGEKRQGKAENSELSIWTGKSGETKQTGKWRIWSIIMKMGETIP